MSAEIERFDLTMRSRLPHLSPHPEGRMVRHSDHLAALDQAVAAERERVRGVLEGIAADVELRGDAAPGPRVTHQRYAEAWAIREAVELAFSPDQEETK